MQTKRILYRVKRLYRESRQELMLIAIALFWSANDMMVHATKGASAFSSAADTISGYEEPVKQLMRAIACVIAIVGAFTIYFKMQNGDQDVKKTIMMVIGGCIAFVALGEALPLFFK